jgi:hypothetical protein
MTEEERKAYKRPAALTRLLGFNVNQEGDEEEDDEVSATVGDLLP